jgi:DNA-binding transcriptional regulator YdaS (Cro superfamily)
MRAMIAPPTLVSYVQKVGVDAAADAVGCSASHIRNVLAGRKRVSPNLAIKLHAASRGAVPGSDLCPELWRSPDDVPCYEAAE